MSKPTFILAIVLALQPAAVLASGTATIQTTGEAIQAAGQSFGGGTETLTIQWRDENTLRMQTSGDPSHVIVRDGKAYSVTRQGGQTMVMAMAALLQRMGAGRAKRSTPGFFGVDAVEPTGESETVAAVDGRVYRMTWTDHAGERKTERAEPVDMQNMMQGFGAAAQSR